MDIARWKRLRTVFEQACERGAMERDAFLESACGDDLDLRREVEGMLAVEGADSEFLESPARERALPEPRSRIGAYEIVRPIASGGMGTVFEAIQDRPHRRVALKIMRLGLFSSDAVRRFEVESELLARLRHPGIAQVYEAGVHAEHGAAETPYFAMEFVESARDLVEHCSAEGLGLAEKLRLFLDVCDAVSYGHQRGVIHRDLKPANLLVGSDGRAKVIDFGVARVTDSDLAAGTLATRSGELLGTLHYMSPEQIAGDPDAVDTRSDVYALGIVLYELLCGRLPYDLEGLPIVHVAITIENDAPKRPRSIDPTIPPDVEWVVLQALEKEPGRRYDSVAGFAEDLRRFLRHEPVVAAPPSTAYRARRFARKHWLPLAAASTVVLALGVGAAVATAGLLEARTENAKFSDLNDVLVDTLTSATLEREGRDVRVADMLDHAREEIPARLAGRPMVEAAMHHALGKSYLSLGLHDEAIEEERAALALWNPRVEPADFDRLDALDNLGWSLFSMGDIPGAREAAGEGARAVLAHLGPEHPMAFEFERLEARLLLDTGDDVAAEARNRSALERARDALGPDHPVTQQLLSDLEMTLRKNSKWRESEALSRQLLAAAERTEGPESFAVLKRKLRLGVTLARLDDTEEAQALFEAALGPFTRIRGEDHPESLTALIDLAFVYEESGDDVRCEAVYREVVPRLERVLGPENRSTLTAKAGLAGVRQRLGDAGLGLDAQREVLETERRVFGPEHPSTVTQETNVAIVLIREGKLEEAEPLVEHSLEVRRRLYGTDDERTLVSLEALGFLLFKRGEYAKVVPLFEETLRVRKELLGPTHSTVLKMAQNLGTALAKVGRYDDALAVYEENLRAHREVLDPSDPVLLLLASNLAELHRMNGEPAQAETVLRDALESAREQLPERHPQIVRAATFLGRCLMDQGRNEEALEFLEEAASLAELNPEVGAQARGQCLGFLGRCLHTLGMRDEAARQLAAAVELFEKENRTESDFYTEFSSELAAIRSGAEERAAGDEDD